MTHTSRTSTLLKYLALSIFAVPMVVPIYMMVVGSFKSVSEAARMNLALPEVWLVENYITVIHESNIVRAFLNSSWITSFSLVMTLASASLAAYFFARNNSRFSRITYAVYALGIVAPLSIVPTIKMLQMLGIMGSYTAVICVFCAINIPFATFLMTGFVKTIPLELEDAAKIDGCNQFMVFARIVFPLLKPVIATTAIITFMNVWNSLFIPLYLLNRSTKWTMPLTVYNFFGQYSSSWNLVFANIMLTALPVTVFYLFCQKFIIKGMVAGAIKG